MESFNFIGALIACALAVMKIFDLLRNRAILRTHGQGNYDYGDKSTEFGYSVTFENTGRRPLFLRNMHVNLLDKRKKRLSIFARVENISRKMDAPDIFEQRFSYRDSIKKAQNVQVKILN